MVQYDPKLLGDTDVISAPFSDKTLSQGHQVTLVAHNHNQRPVCLKTVVTDVTCVTIPHNGVSINCQMEFWLQYSRCVVQEVSFCTLKVDDFPNLKFLFI